MSGSRTRTRLTADDGDGIREALADDGFVQVCGVLPKDEVEAVRRAIDEILDRYSPDSDILTDHDDVPRKICYPLGKSECLLPVLAHPSLGRVVEAVAGGHTEVVLTWEDILLKPAIVGARVLVHQDLALQRGSGLVFSIQIHLHDAVHNPVWFLPGSHRRGALTRTEVRNLQESEPFLPLAPRAGDIVVHDVYCVHYSDSNSGPTRRDTWYLEFRALDQLLRDGPWPRHWVERRRAILFHAAARRASTAAPTWWPQTHTRPAQSWLAEPLDLRVQHTGDGIEFDLLSPYYHFG